MICEAAFRQDQIDNWFDIILPKGIDAWNSLPALSAVITTATGIYKYNGGDLWGAFPAFASVSARVKWGKQFKRFIEQHETLESFQNLEGHKYVAPILAHGGIPQYCLFDFFTLLIRCGDPEQPGSEFINNIGSETTSLTNIDEPVKRFLLYGGEVAEEFVSRCLSLWLSHESGKDEGTHGLPKRVVDAFSEWYKAQTPSQHSRRQRFPKPQIKISPWDLWVYLYLPRCDLHPGIEQSDFWETIDRKWAVSRDHNVSLPLRDKWTVKCNEHEVVLKGVSDTAPVMFFDPDTRKVISNPEVRRLPEYLWAVIEKSHNISPAPVSSEEIPYWPDHVFIELDLSGQQCVLIDEKRYEVRRPFFHVGQEPVVTGVTTGNNLPVYHQPPEINWEGEANFSFIQNGNDEGNIDITSTDFQIWFDKPGSYEFHLRGPLGQNIHKSFYMLPNLNLDLRPNIRWPAKFSVKCNISSDQVDIRGPDGQSPPFVSHKSCIQFKAIWNELETELMVTVPRLKWRILKTAGEVPDWGDEPLNLSLRDLETAEYPRLICNIEPLTTEANLCLASNHGLINTIKPQQNSAHIEQNFWSFDLRMVSDQIRRSGKAEEFEILVHSTDGNELYRGVILTVTPEWNLQNFRSDCKKDEITITWKESGPVIMGRYLIMLPLWRPWEDAIQADQLNVEERHIKHWHIPDIRPGRYIVRTVHAPWGHNNWRNAQYLNQEILDINMGLLSSVFECESEAEKTIKMYFEHLVAHWYRPEEVTVAPRTPVDLTPQQINDFLTYLEQTDSLIPLKIPRDNSGSLSIFCMNPQATTEAVGTKQDFSDIWKQVLPSQDVIFLNPGKHDRAFIHDVAFQYTMLESISAVKEVKSKNKWKHLSEPMQQWHRNLRKKKPPPDEVIFLCQKFDLFSKGTSPADRQEYDELKRRYLNREAV